MFSQGCGNVCGRRFATLSLGLLLAWLGASIAEAQESTPPASPAPGADPQAGQPIPQDTYQPVPEATYVPEGLAAPIPQTNSQYHAANSAGRAGCSPYACGSQCGRVPGTCDDCRNTRVFRSEILGHLWFDAELLAWATKGQNLPPLVTSTPGGGGSPSILFGNEKIHDELRVGGRLTVGWWCGLDRRDGVEGYYFALDGDEQQFRATGADIAVLPPIVDASFLDGSIALEVDTEFSGAGALWRRGLWGSPNHRIDLLLGYRYARLYDDLFRGESLDSLDPASGVPLGTNISRSDFFESRNEFHGGEAGLQGRWRRNRWSVELLGKVALGGTRSDVKIDGSTVIVDPATITTLDGGVLAQPSNIGRYTSQDFAVVSEFGVSLQYDIHCNLRASLGYTYLYWSQVVRALEHIEPVANPSFELDDTSFWAQGLNCGLEYQF